MLRMVMYRLAIAIPTLLVVTAVTYILMSVIPGDAAIIILGSGATPEKLAAFRAELGLDQPWYVQWFHGIGQLFQGSMGKSLYDSEPVVDKLNRSLPITLSLVLLAAAISTVVGVTLGSRSALRPGASSKAIDVFAIVAMAIPGFWLGIVLIVVFATNLRWFPPGKYVAFDVDPAQWISHLFLPVIALAFSTFGTKTRTTRDAMLDAWSSDHIRSLRANGVSQRSLRWKHALRAAAPNIVTVISLGMIFALTGSAFVESVFSLNGLGSLAAEASGRNDIPVIQGVAIYFTVMVIVINLLVDISYALLNPKVRN